jgi:hypothetical protein
MPSLSHLPWPAPNRALAAAWMVALGLAACQAKEEPLTHADPPAFGDRVMVLNADSLVIDGRHVHLSNASAPQGVLHARCWAEAIAAENGVAFVRDMVQHAVSIDFKPIGKIDGYNRELGLVTIDKADLGDTLYARGMAARLTDPRFDWCQPISQRADGAPPISSLINLGQ